MLNVLQLQLLPLWYLPVTRLLQAKRKLQTQISHTQSIRRVFLFLIGHH